MSSMYHLRMRDLDELAEKILALTATELLDLNKLLRDAGGPDIGVREPATPPPRKPAGTGTTSETGAAPA